MVHFYHRSRRHTKKIQQNRNRRKSEIGWNIKVKVCNFFYHLVVTTIHLFCKYATTAFKSIQSSTIRCFYSQCLFKIKHSIQFYSLVKQKCENGFFFSNILDNIHIQILYYVDTDITMSINGKEVTISRN